MHKVLVIAVHPDDETLGCGGTILRHRERGDEVYWLIVTNISEKYGYDRSRVRDRQKEIDRVSREYGFKDVFKLNMPAARLDQVPRHDLVESVRKVIDSVKPDTVILPYEFDVHSDHRIGFEAAYSCIKVFRHPSVRKVMMMEVLSETEYASAGHAFTPNCFVDVTEHLERKIGILNLYKGETGRHPFPRSEESVRAIATSRGAAAGCRYAEGFMILKEIC
jgi:LmbE family N-acetylglucosaminyl deacetylase